MAGEGGGDASWWKGKKADGTVGLFPSNYVEVIEDGAEGDVGPDGTNAQVATADATGLPNGYLSLGRSASKETLVTLGQSTVEGIGASASDLADRVGQMGSALSDMSDNIFTSIS